MSLDSQLKVKAMLLGKLCHLTSKPFCLFRLMRIHKLNKRLDAIERVIEG